MLLHEFHGSALERIPEKTALICGDEGCTYADLDNIVAQYARALQGLGIKHGDRVGILMKNCLELVYLYCACFRTGAVAVPICHYHYKPDGMIYVANQFGIKLLITQQDLYDLVKGIEDAVSSLERILLAETENPQEEQSWKKAVREAPETFEPPEIKPDDPAVIFHTSGSTGKPKGVTHTHDSLYHATIYRNRALGLTDKLIFLTDSQLTRGATPMNVLLPVLYNGGTAVFRPTSNAGEYLEDLARHRVTQAASTPEHLWEILEHPLAGKTDFGNIEYFTSGGDAIPVHLFELFHRVTGKELSQSIGMTECGTYMTNFPSGKSRRGSIGTPVHGYEVSIIDSQGMEVPRGREGEIKIRSKALFSGYWNDPENTGKTIIDGWLHTGDIAFQDNDGFYFFKSRIKNIIVRGCVNIAPGEVEEALNQHSKIKYSGVVGVPDKKYGEAIHAFIVVDKGAGAPPDVEELRAFAAERLGPVKVPGHWTFIDDIPHISMGKIDRKGLKEMTREYIQ